MYNVSDDYIEKINSTSKQVYWYGTVTLPDNTVYDFDTSNMAQGQTKISRELCNTNAIRVGGTCSSELQIAFMLDYDGEYYTFNGLLVDRYAFYNAKIRLVFRLYLDNDAYEDVELGTYTVENVERKQMTLVCTAYDDMQKFNMACISEIQGLPYNVLLQACAICGVELGSSIVDLANMTNGRKTVAMYDPKNEINTWRDVVGFIASMLCANAVIKADNKLYLIPFSIEPVRILSGNNRISLSLEEYVNNYRVLTAVNLRTNTEDKVADEESGMTYAMGSNPLMQYVTHAERSTVLANILNELKQYTYTPFSGEFFCDPSLELGDVIAFTGNHAFDSTLAIITSLEISISGHMKMSCEGEDPNLSATADAANPETSEYTSGSVGDGVSFYDYTSDDEIIISNASQITSISFDTNGKFRQEFAAEIEIEVATTESLTSNTYSESGECLITAAYYLNGIEVDDIHPQCAYADGKHLLHLMYFWDSDLHIETGTLEVNLSVSGGTVTVGKVHSRIMQSGTAYPAISNIISYIDVTKEPTKPMYWRGQAIDYTGVQISAEYEDGRIVDITNQCTFNPAAGSIVTTAQFINVDVSYVNGGKTYNTAFGMEEIIPDTLVITPPDRVDYYADLDEVLDYTGLIVKCKFTDGTQLDVTNQCTFNPADHEAVTADTSTYVTVNYLYQGNRMTEGFDINVFLPDSLLVTEPDETTYYVDDEETLDYTGLSVTLKYDNGFERVITDECVLNPVEGTLVTENTPYYVTVTYNYQGRQVIDGFDLDIETVEFNLKYIDYTQDDDNHLLRISGLVTNEIKEDKLKALRIHSTYTDEQSSITYGVKLI